MNAIGIRTTSALFLVSLAATAGADQSGNHGPHMWGGGGWMGWFAGPVMMVTTIAILVAVVMLMVRWLGGTGRGAIPENPASTAAKAPLDILKERYARGEIDKDEFEERKRVLDA